ncbi:hypothetical protein [Burkholderia vietnamiensis]|nr:hypothetical protein [Burkholderia vietnamiensis]KVF78910.1 hypothetical protein WJ18_16105 [Burkholderia vietnamiensis]KVF82604.1 hypothetical protein WJ19_24810 [Burkholderia vietnamiensis]KVF86400.1 hypothetical protein WJ20_24110 [Burkholderia vietnamiensis]KVG02852.1 hypothetical protein WJ22_08630 [Burkholderia vietnamiensis]
MDRIREWATPSSVINMTSEHPDAIPMKFAGPKVSRTTFGGFDFPDEVAASPGVIARPGEIMSRTR